MVYSRVQLLWSDLTTQTEPKDQIHHGLFQLDYRCESTPNHLHEVIASHSGEPWQKLPDGTSCIPSVPRYCCYTVRYIPYYDKSYSTNGRETTVCLLRHECSSVRTMSSPSSPVAKPIKCCDERALVQRGL